MKKYKAIILGSPCSGKTTLKKYLESHHELPLLEEDDFFTDLNGGSYPQDDEHKEEVLRPKLEEKLRKSDNLILLTSFCRVPLLEQLRSEGFKIIQLVLDKSEFEKRNKKRMKEEGCNDVSRWADLAYIFHERIQKEGMVDKQIDADQPTEAVAKQVLDYLG